VLIASLTVNRGDWTFSCRRDHRKCWRNSALMTTDLNDYQLLPIFLVSIVVILAAAEIGRWLGVRGGGEENVPTLEGAVLGLLALMIGFTFAMALSRFELRRDAVLDEANAIGTTALRARLLPAPHNAECVKLLKDYVQLRLDLTQRVLSLGELNAAITRSNAIQEALWQQAKAVAATDTEMVPTGLFIQSLNEMIDNQAKHLNAIRDRVPNIVFLTLYGVAHRKRLCRLCQRFGRATLAPADLCHDHFGL
jgi:hypothetical protein